MRNKKVLTVVALAGLTIGGLSLASSVSAQTYGGAPETPTTETPTTETPTSVPPTTEAPPTEAPTVESGTAIDSEGANDAGAVLVQTAAETEGDTPDADGQRTIDRGQRPERHGGCNLEAAAEAIGITETDLRAALDGGETIADVARSNNVSIESVIGAIVDAKVEHVVDKLAEGELTQEEADEKLQDLQGRVSDRVNGVDAGPQP